MFVDGECGVCCFVCAGVYEFWGVVLVRCSVDPDDDVEAGDASVVGFVGERVDCAGRFWCLGEGVDGLADASPLLGCVGGVEVGAVDVEDVGSDPAPPQSLFSSLVGFSAVE